MTLSQSAADLRAHVQKSAGLLESRAVSRAQDLLIVPYLKLEDQKAELNSLKKETNGMVWVRQDGNRVIMEPLDQEAFRGIQDKIRALSAKVEHNQGVLDRLDDACVAMGLEEFSLNGLVEKRKELQNKIKAVERKPRQDLGHIFQACVTLGEGPEKRPEVIEARAKAAEDAAPLREEVDRLNGMIEQLEHILAEFN